MFIKTVSTTSGINPIKFDETGGVFYWILNTGSSTIYASTKSAFTAGDDGVVSLGPKESRRLETNNDTIYILGEGQVEIHNQRDGICSFKQAPTSSGSGGGGTIDAYTKTESDAKYAAKTDVPDAYTKTESDAKYASKELYGDTTINVGREAGSDVGEYSTAIGHNTTASGVWSHAEGNNTTASSDASHAEGDGTIASDSAAHAEGISTHASANASHAEGVGTTASGVWSHAEGDNTTASSDASHAEGDKTVASGASSHAEGSGAKASGISSHAEGGKTVASGASSHAEGANTTADGYYSHAEGYYTIAGEDASHAEGKQTTASGPYSHAEGGTVTASGICSHAEGSSTTASGFASHAEGQFTIANNDAEHASGKYNVSNEDTLFSVGDGTDSDNRHNAFEITKTGGKLHDRDIGVLYTQAESAALRIDIPDGVDVAQWLTQNAKSGMPYLISTRGSRTGLPNVSADWMWFSYDGNRYFARAWTGDIHTSDFVLDAVNSIGGWKEISYTPIKSTTISASTDGNGFFTLWGSTENKVPVAFRPLSFPDMIFIPMSSTSNWTARCVHSDFSAFSSIAIGDVKVFYIEI